MSKTNYKTTTEAGKQKINWTDTIVGNILVFICHYIIALFGGDIILSLFGANGTNTERGGYILNLIGEKADYYGVVYGGFIKLPLIFMILSYILVFIIFRRSLYKLYKMI
jgi:hypothetical protein